MTRGKKIQRFKSKTTGAVVVANNTDETSPSSQHKAVGNEATASC